MDEEITAEEARQVKKLLEQNLGLTKEIYAMTKKIKSYLAWQRLVGLVYLFLIIAPIILGAIFLPPLLKPMIDQYKDLLGVQPGVGSLNVNSVKNLLNQ